MWKLWDHKKLKWKLIFKVLITVKRVEVKIINNLKVCRISWENAKIALILVSRVNEKNRLGKYANARKLKFFQNFNWIRHWKLKLRQILIS